MASNEDVAFLRGLVQNGFLDPAQASQCTQVLDQRTSRGERVTALQVAVELGLVDPRRLEAEVKSRSGSQRMTPVQREGAPPGTSSGDSRRVARPGTQSGAGPPGVKSGDSRRMLRPTGAPGPGTTQSGGSQRLATSREDARPAPGPGTSQAGPGASQAGSQRLATSREDARPAPGPGTSQAGPGASQAGSQRLAMPTGGLGVSREDARPPVELAELTEYEPGARLGAGPVGPSYLGRRKVDGAEVVIKLINPRFQEHPELLEAVLRDLRSWSGFDAPGATGPLAVGTLGGQRVVIWRKLAPETLEQALARGPLPPRQAMAAVQVVARALVPSHGRNQGAGDIRAAKIHWDGQRAVLTDLGLARASSLGGGFGQYGLTWGHPSCLAPEVLQEGQRHPTPAADVYALGILLYQLVIGRLPFQGTAQELLTQHLEAALPPPPPGQTQVSLALAGLILRMTAKSPERRLPDARAVVEQLQALIERTPDAPLQPPPPRKKPPAAAPGRSQEALLAEALATAKEGPEEFDPTRSLCNEDEWGSLVTKEQRQAAGWSKKKIAEPVKVGPKDWDEASVDEANAKASLELRSALEAAMAAQAKAKTAGAKPARMVSGSGGGGGAPSGQFAKWVGACVVVVVVMIGLAVRPKPPRNAPPPPTPGHTPLDPYTPPTPEQLAAEAKDREALAARVADWEAEVKGEADRNRFARALEAVSRPPSELARAPGLDAAVERIRAHAFQRIDEHLIRTTEKEFQDYVRVDELDAARRLLEGVAAWAETRPPYEALRRQLERLLRAKQLEIERLGRESKGAAPDVDLERARQLVSTKLSSGQAKVYAGGGVVVNYRDAQAILSDLVCLQGPKPQLEPVPGLGVSGVRVVSKDKRPTILLHTLPLDRPIDVTLDLIVAPQPAPEKAAKVAIVGGLSREIPQGVGTAWGLSPVQLIATQKKLVEQNSGITPVIEPMRALCMELTVDYSGREGLYEIGGSLLARKEGTREARRDEGVKIRRSIQDVRGQLGLFVEGCEVWITGLEVRGRLDLKLLEKPEARPPVEAPGVRKEAPPRAPQPEQQPPPGKPADKPQGKPADKPSDKPSDKPAPPR